MGADQMTDSYADIPSGFQLVSPSVPDQSAPQLDDIPPGFNVIAPSALSDIARSIPQYGETALTSLAGMPGDVANLASKGISYLGGPQMPHYAGAADLQQKLNELQGGALYQPQTTWGQAGNVGAALLPAMLGGPENVALKLATRVGGPAAAITGIQNTSAIPEAAKPYAEAATVLFAPFAANRIIGATLKRFGVGVLPTTAQMQATNAEFAKLHAAATTPAQQAQTFAAWKEVTQRYMKMKSIEAALGGQNPANLTPAVIGQKMSKINPNQFSPVEQTQLANTIADAGAREGLGHQVARGVASISPSVSVAGAYPLVAQLVAGSPSLGHLIVAGVAPAIGLAAKVAYPHLGQSQIDKLIEIVKRGLPVKGVPNYSPVTGGYSPLTPGLAAAPLADQGNQ